MKKDSKMWRFLFGENVSSKEACYSIFADVLILVCALAFIPYGNNGSLFDRAKQGVISYQIAYNEQKAQKEVCKPIEGYSFVKFYHLVVAETKKDEAFYCGQQAALFKGENNYLLRYKADGEVKKLFFKNWSDRNCEGVIVEDGRNIRFASVYSDNDGCEFSFFRNGAMCDFYFYRKL